MSNKVYVGDYGTIIEIDTGADLSDATLVRINVKKPDGSETSWSGTASGTKIQHTIQANELPAIGAYKLQAEVQTPAGRWLGETVVMPVHEKFS